MTDHQLVVDICCATLLLIKKCLQQVARLSQVVAERELLHNTATTYNVQLVAKNHNEKYDILP